MAALAKAYRWILAALMLLGFLVWLRRSDLPPGANPAISNNDDPSAKTKRESRSNDYKDPRLKKLSTVEFSEAEIEGVLNKRGRSPAALILAYGLKFDPKLLYELESHSDKPIALNALALDSSDPTIRLHWALELEHKLGLENGYGSLVVAKAMADLGKKDEAALYLKRAAEAPKFEGFGRQMMEEAAQVSGCVKPEQSIYIVTTNKAVPSRNWMVNVFADSLLKIPSAEGGEFTPSAKNELIGSVLLKFAQDPNFEGFGDGPTTTQLAFEKYQGWLAHTKQDPKYSQPVKAAIDLAKGAAGQQLKYHDASPEEVDVYMASKLKLDNN